MRKFQRQSRLEEDYLNRLFPELEELYQSEDTANYQHLAVSVFDHILNVDEARRYIDNVTLDEEHSNDRKLHEFCCSLAIDNECYSVKPIGRRKRHAAYRKYLSHSGVRDHLEPKPYNWGSRGRFVLVFPKIECVYFEGWDFTHHVYYKDESKLEPFRGQVKESDLCILQ